MHEYSSAVPIGSSASYGEGMSMKTQTTIIISVLLLTGIALLTSGSKGSDGSKDQQDITKVVKFSHKFHAEQGVGCTDCHTAVSTSEQSSDLLLPKMKDCASCHDVNTDCEKCHFEQKPYPSWEKSAPEIRFSHKFHLEKSSDGGLECKTCHAGVDTVTYATASQLPLMESCISCHNNDKAPKACETCHTDIAHLYPENHKIGNFLREHKKFVLTSIGVENCSTCHSENYCEECHDANAVLHTTPTPRSTISPHAPSLQSKTPILIERIHDLNYRYTHGIEAQAHAVECQSCHLAQIFCADCHSASGVFARIKPQSHLAPNFVTIGRGSGGGRHAELARKDIEACAACHDQEGRDPTCTLCHTDPDGIRGNDPRTHQSGFMADVHGDWHENQGAVCYNCHTDPNAYPGGKPGIGFCGYCHGEKD